MGHNWYTDGLKTISKSKPIYCCTVRCCCCQRALSIEAVSLSKIDVQDQVRAAGWTQVRQDEKWIWVSPVCKTTITAQEGYHAGNKK